VKDVIFSNPPLVELIAELRWVPGAESPAAQGQIQGGQNQFVQTMALQFPIASPFLEESFSRFSNEAVEKGFSISERLIPPGFPLLPFIVVYRFRKPPASGGNYLYQIGPGIFSANALPPYRNWEAFRPIVREGVEALLASRHPSENIPFATVLLRYIDLFSEEFTGRQRSFRFLNDILGLKLALPAALSQQFSSVNDVQCGIHLSMRLANGLAMNLAVQDGTAAGKPGIVMSTEVLSMQPTMPDVSRIMETLENAHASIRTTFVGLTEKLHAKMQPVQ
jgi:uncharacterized protein (TIGR04255 family)